MKLLKWAVGGASAYVIYKYSIGRKAKGEDVFVTPEKAVEKIATETAPAKKRAPGKTSSAKASKPAAAQEVTADPPVPDKPKRKRAPRKKPAQ